jgi:tetratricopeptide (TPR) repeat protein
MAYFRVLLAVLAAFLAFGGAMATTEDATRACLDDDYSRRIKGCTTMLETPGLPDPQRSLAFGMRALAYSLLGMFNEAISDYDEALKIKPDFALALNNRAWAYYKIGRAADGFEDVNTALKLSPGSPYALDTRAHIQQAMGDAKAAIEDYEMAIFTGGGAIIKMYQCGLRAMSLYDGPVDGRYSSSLQQSLRTCAKDPKCDPVPSDSECRPEVS